MAKQYHITTFVPLSSSHPAYDPLLFRFDRDVRATVVPDPVGVPLGLPFMLIDDPGLETVFGRLGVPFCFPPILVAGSQLFCRPRGPFPRRARAYRELELDGSLSLSVVDDVIGGRLLHWGENG